MSTRLAQKAIVSPKKLFHLKRPKILIKVRNLNAPIRLKIMLKLMEKCKDKEMIHKIKRMMNYMMEAQILVSYVKKNAFTEKKFIIDVINVISITATGVTIEVDTLI